MRLPREIGPIHFVGIGGIGMSGIAEVLCNLGYTVQGSDASESANVSRLRDKGIAKDSSGDEMGFRIVTGKGTMVLPGVQAVRRLSLDLHQADLQVDCVTHQGIPLGLKGVVIFKVGDDFTSIANAARRFLDQQAEAKAGAARRPGGGARPPVVEGHDVPVVREGVGHRLPHPLVVGEPVQQHDVDRCGAFAVLADGDRHGRRDLRRDLRLPRLHVTNPTFHGSPAGTKVGQTPDAKER